MNPLFIFLIMNPSLWWSTISTVVFPVMFSNKKKTDKESNAVDN